MNGPLPSTDLQTDCFYGKGAARRVLPAQRAGNAVSQRIAFFRGGQRQKNTAGDRYTGEIRLQAAPNRAPGGRRDNVGFFETGQFAADDFFRATINDLLQYSVASPTRPTVFLAIITHFDTQQQRQEPGPGGGLPTTQLTQHFSPFAPLPPLLLPASPIIKTQTTDLYTLTNSLYIIYYLSLIKLARRTRSGS